MAKRAPVDCHLVEGSLLYKRAIPPLLDRFTTKFHAIAHHRLALPQKWALSRGDLSFVASFLRVRGFLFPAAKDYVVEPP